LQWRFVTRQKECHVAAKPETWLRRIFKSNQELESAKADFADARDRLLAQQKSNKELMVEFNEYMLNGGPKQEPLDEELVEDADRAVEERELAAAGT
jgi:hypothetical protein